MNAPELRAFMNSLACKPEDKATYEVALQLAELNERIDRALQPGKIVDLIVAVQGEIDKRGIDL
jgi:hypothetical protein